MLSWRTSHLPPIRCCCYPCRAEPAGEDAATIFGPSTIKEWCSNVDGSKHPWLNDNGASTEVLSADLIWRDEVQSLAESEDDAKRSDIAALVTTSGTTGKPKAVMHSQGAFFALATSQRQQLTMNFGSTILPFDQGYISLLMV